MNSLRKKVCLSLMAMLFISISAHASVPDEVEGYLNLEGSYTSLVNNQVEFETLATKCTPIKNTNGDLEIKSDSKVRLTADLKNSKYSTHSDAETVSIYESLAPSQNNETVKKICGEKTLKSYKQLVVVAPYSISIQETFDCGASYSNSQTCSVSLF